MRIEEIWYGGDIRSKLGRIVLFPLSLLYTAGWQTYLFIYKIGLKKAHKPHTPIVCIGNFSSGGNGKTPTVAWIAKELTKRGLGVVIGCSGYGSPKSEAATIAPSGTLSPSEWGDEPAEFRLMLPEIPIIVGGGIRTERQLQEAYEAGADLVVVGTAFENDPEVLFALSEVKDRWGK